MFAALTAALAVGCGPPTATRDGETLVLAVRADTTGFFPNPPIANEAFTSEVNRNIFEAPVRLDGQLRLVPELAERWSTPEENRFVFELKSGVRFSDGRPLAAADVAASINAAKRWVYRENFHAIEEAHALDERRVEVRTRSSFAVLLTRLPWALVVPADAVAASPVPTLGTGPYRLESRDPGKEIVLSRNPHYHGAAPDFPRVRFRVVPDAEARVAAVLEGQADAADQVPIGRLGALAGREDVRLISRRECACCCSPCAWTGHRSPTRGCARRSTSPSTARSWCAARWRDRGSPPRRSFPP